MNKGKQRVLPYLWQITYGSRMALILLTVLEAAQSFFSIALVLSMRMALDGAELRNGEIFWRGVMQMAALLLLQIILRAATRYLNERAHVSVENGLKKRLFHHLLVGDYASVEATHSGEWMNRMTSDTAVVAGGLCEILPQLTGMIVKLAGALILLLTLMPKAWCLLIPAGVLAVGITWLLRGLMKKQHKRVQEKDGAARSFLQERLGHLMIVRAFRAEQAVEAEADHRMNGYKKARMLRSHLSNLCNFSFAAAINALYILSFAYCGYGIVIGTMSYGTLLAVIQLVGQLQGPFAGLTGILPRYYAMTASAERLLIVEGFPAEKAAVPDAPTDFTSLQLKDVGFSYPDGERISVFSHVSFCVNKGEYLALIGNSGCGKSTLFKLLLALYAPASGSVTVTDAAGCAISLGTEHRGLFSYVPQGNQMMSGTVAEVICFGGDPDEDRLWQALRIACAEEFVRALPEGLDTLLGERGAGLSEGQLQRLAIARAIYADPPILLFDEATSALDEATEREVLENLRSVTDKTLLIVTHRPAALDICDRILEVADGCVRERMMEEGADA